MHAVPPALNGVYAKHYKFFKLTGSKYGGVTYHAYTEISPSDWRWCTPIREISDEGNQLVFKTHSGSVYTVESPIQEDLPHAFAEHLRFWFQAETMEPVCLSEVLLALKVNKDA